MSQCRVLRNHGSWQGRQKEQWVFAQIWEKPGTGTGGATQGSQLLQVTRRAGGGIGRGYITKGLTTGTAWTPLKLVKSHGRTHSALVLLSCMGLDGHVCVHVCFFAGASTCVWVHMHGKAQCWCQLITLCRDRINAVWIWQQTYNSSTRRTPVETGVHTSISSIHMSSEDQTQFFLLQVKSLMITITIPSPKDVRFRCIQNTLLTSKGKRDSLFLSHIWATMAWEHGLRFPTKTSSAAEEVRWDCTSYKTKKILSQFIWQISLWGPPVGRLKQSQRTGLSRRQHLMTVLVFMLVETEWSAKNKF